MSEILLSEIYSLRKEHEDLSAKRVGAEALLAERTAHPRKRDIAIAVATYLLTFGTLRGPAVEDRMLGHKVVETAIDLSIAYDTNNTLASQHKDAHFDDYIQMARHDMESHFRDTAEQAVI